MKVNTLASLVAEFDCDGVAQVEQHMRGHLLALCTSWYLQVQLAKLLKRVLSDSKHLVNESAVDQAFRFPVVASLMSTVPVGAVVLDAEPKTCMSREQHVQVRATVERHHDVLRATTEHEIEDIEDRCLQPRRPGLRKPAAAAAQTARSEAPA